MDKETLSNYGWIVICVLVLAVMIALATPFGDFVADAVKSTTQGLFDVNQNALNAAGVPGLTVNDQSFDGAGSNSTTTIDHNGPTIPEGAYYGKMNMETGNVTWYAEMPTTVSVYDIYAYGDYIYLYYDTWNVILAEGDYLTVLSDVPFNGTDRNQKTYDAIIESINGMPVTNLFFNIFKDCTFLESITIPSSVTAIGEKAFYNCTNLTSITIPEGVTTIDYNTFQNCTSLTSITLPDSVTAIGTAAFSGCTSLTSIIIPEGVKRINNSVFHDCQSLTSITIPSTITEIRPGAIGGCISLENIFFNGTMEQWRKIDMEHDAYVWYELPIICSDGTI